MLLLTVSILQVSANIKASKAALICRWRRWRWRRARRRSGLSIPAAAAAGGGAAGAAAAAGSEEHPPTPHNFPGMHFARRSASSAALAAGWLQPLAHLCDCPHSTLLLPCTDFQSLLLQALPNAAYPVWCCFISLNISETCVAGEEISAAPDAEGGAGTGPRDVTVDIEAPPPRAATPQQP